MPHADASKFQDGIGKKAAYASVRSSLGSLVENQTNWVCNTANTASLLWHMYRSLPAPGSRVNWAGFYTVDPKDPSQLMLGPFQGKVACQTIKIGRGVCGRAAAREETVLVTDVHDFPGHIACDGDSRSEIVVPILKGERLVGVIDIDCAEINGFDSDDKVGLEAIAELLANASEW